MTQPDPAPSSRCTGAILAGGRATRYGGAPKGLERVMGERIIDRVLRALRESCDDVLLIANDPASNSWLPGVKAHADLIEGAGGLGGIHSALVHSGEDVIVVAWDMPFVPPSLLAELRARGRDADAVVPASDSRRGMEPLCAFYSRRCLEPVQLRLSQNDMRVIAFHGDVRLRTLSREDVARHGDPAMIFMNVNTPEELRIAESYASSANGNHRR